MLTSGTTITVPEISDGCRCWITRSSAMMDVYSVPCAPLTSAKTGPGFEPRMTATGMRVPASDPAGTSMDPLTFSPGAADAVPTVNLVCENATVQSNRMDAKNREINLMAAPQ